MKTAMQELIETLESQGLEMFGIEEFLEKEKQQTIDFADKSRMIDDVDFDGNISFVFDTETLFNETFKND